MTGWFCLACRLTLMPSGAEDVSLIVRYISSYKQIYSRSISIWHPVYFSPISKIVSVLHNAGSFSMYFLTALHSYMVGISSYLNVSNVSISSGTWHKTTLHSNPYFPSYSSQPSLLPRDIYVTLITPPVSVLHAQGFLSLTLLLFYGNGH